MDKTGAELIHQRKSEGRLDSAGDFTLDPGRAKQLLQKHLLEEPQLYVLCLIGAALAHGADNLKILVEPQSFQLSYMEPLLTDEELESLSSTPTGSRYIQSLHLGLVAARALSPKQILVESELAGRWSYRGGKTHFKKEARVGAGVRISVTFAKGLLSAWSRGSKMDPGVLIQQRCRLARQEITVNGRRINREPDLGVALAQREVESSTPAVFSLGGATSEVQVVVNGVSYPYEGELEFEKVRGVIYHDGLRPDLSQCRLVQNSTWDGLREWINKKVRDLVGSLDESWETMNDRQRSRALPFLDRLAELESRAGNLSRAQAIYERLLVLRAQQAPSTDPDVLLNLSNLGTLYFLQKGHEQALEIFLAIAEDLQKLDRLDEAITYFERVLGLETQVSPKSDEALLKATVGWAECCLQQERWGHAEVLIRSALPRLKPDTPVGKSLMARLERIRQTYPEFADLALFQLGTSEPRCRRCGSRRLVLEQAVEGLKVGGRAVNADVCGACGYLDLAVEDFGGLWEQSNQPG